MKKAGWVLLACAPAAGAAAQGAAAGDLALAGVAPAPLERTSASIRQRLPGDSSWTLAAPDGDRRTLGALPANVARGVVGVFARENLTPFLIGVGASFTGSGFDRGAARLVRDDCPACGRTGAKVGGVAVVPAVGALFLAGQLGSSSRLRAFSYDLAEATIVDSVWTSALKYSSRRTRPDRRDRLSFPSGHASTAFSVATVTERHFGWKAGLPAYAAAAFVGYSRIERNRHNLSDVLAGAALGVIVGRTVTRLNGGVPARRSLSIAPLRDASGGGVGLGVSASW